MNFCIFFYEDLVCEGLKLFLSELKNQSVIHSIQMLQYIWFFNCNSKWSPQTSSKVIDGEKETSSDESTCKN